MWRGSDSALLCACCTALRGANNCIYDTRAMASEMQSTYADSNNGNGEGYSWRHYTDNCNACPGGNTNSYGPDNLFDDPITYPSAGGDFCSDSGYTAGWVAVNLTVPTLITSYKLRARNWNEFPKTFRFQGSNDWVNWVDIETRSTASHQLQTNEERIFWVGIPTDVPGIPLDIMESYNNNPLLYGGVADNRNICVLGDNDAGRGRGEAVTDDGHH
eukprot:COSAG02_NODE_3005_length_7570_cov_3.554812_6_plen_216_part_00